MKQYFSVLAIATRSTIYKIILVFTAMITVQILLFLTKLNSFNNNDYILFDEFIRSSHTEAICAIAFILLCIILSLFGYDRKGSQSKYTIRRLSVSEKTSTTIWSIYNMICFVLFYAIQLFILLILAKIYTNYLNPSIYDSHTVFVSFYKSNFLHSFLPLDETSRYIRNIIIIIALGASTASFSLTHRRGSTNISSIFFLLFIIIFFSQEMGNFPSDLFMIFISILASIYYFKYIWSGDLNEE